MGKKDNKGWFRIERKYLEDELWLAEPFTRGQAWIDLIGLARFEDGEVYINGKYVFVPRGSVRTSYRDLSKRWKWSEKRVRAFVGMLIGQKMVSTQGSTQGTTLTIENYAKYQSQGRTQGSTQDSMQGSTQDARKTHAGRTLLLYEECKEGEEGKEENDVASAPSPAPKQHSNNYIPDDEPLPKHVEDWLARTVSTIPRRRTDR